jgi:tetratricopeptide (TPR) repeat protein
MNGFRFFASAMAAMMAVPAAAAGLQADFDRAVAAFDDKDYNAALAQFDALVPRYEAAYKDAVQPLYCGRDDDERKAYQALIDRQSAGTLVDAGFCQSLFGQAYSYNELQRPGAAVAPLRRAVQIAPLALGYRIELAYTLSAAGELGESTTQYQQVLDLGIAQGDEAAQARALRGLGAGAIARKDWGRAKEYYLRSQKLEPDSAVAKGQLEYIAEQSGG